MASRPLTPTSLGWSHQAAAAIQRPVWIAVLYFVMASASLLLTRLDGGLALIWAANAVLLPELMRTPRSCWPALLVAGYGASLAASVLFGLGAAAAPWISACATAEAMLGAVLLRNPDGASLRFDSLGSTARFIAVAGIIAPLATAFPAAAIATLTTGKLYWASWLNWLTAHSLGTVAFTPLLMLALRGEIGAAARAAGRRELAEAAAYLLLCVTIVGLTFYQTRYPLLFLPLLPLVLMSFRFGVPGAAAALVILTVGGGGLSLAGYGPVQLVQHELAERLAFFQFYIAVTVLIALPVAAELSWRKVLLGAVADSEARFRSLADCASDAILSLSIDGIVLYASPAVADLGGYDPAALVGHPASDLIGGADRPGMAAAHTRVLADPAMAHSSEYSTATATGEMRWFETNSRATVDGNGVVTGVVCAIRDISVRKAAALEQARAAATDPLTGIANRRAFVALLEAALAATGSGPGCYAQIDLDHFKQINDRHGHDAGDRTLCAFAELAVATIGDHGQVARIGGEEFGIIFPASDIAAALCHCERLRIASSSLRVPARHGGLVSFTISVGIAPAPAGASAEAVMAAADTAMYDAKASGRDRVVLAP